MNELVGVVYSEKSKIVRRIIYLDADASMADAAMVQAGESLVTFVNDEDRFRHPEDAKHEAWRLIGVDSGRMPTGHCAVVDAATNLVTNVIVADPELDSMDGAYLVVSDIAEVGWKYEGRFLARYIEIDRASNDATTAIVRRETWLDPMTPQTATLLKDSAARIGAEIAVDPIFVVASSGTTVLA